MPSSIAWLDVSAEEQRRAREFLALFTQPESRDELGIGQVRDARRWIEVLRAAGTVAGGIHGLIGVVAGERLKILPSSIYWNGLITFGILRRDTAAR